MKHKQSFIGKEFRKVGISNAFRKDTESSLGDIPTRWFGVRKSRQVGMKAYDDIVGRFFQIDPLYEKYYSWTPYHYSVNNPVSFLDGNGLYIVNDLSDGSELSGYIIQQSLSLTGLMILTAQHNSDYPVEYQINKKQCDGASGAIRVFPKDGKYKKVESSLFPKFKGNEIERVEIYFDPSHSNFDSKRTPAHENWHFWQAHLDYDTYISELFLPKNGLHKGYIIGDHFVPGATDAGYIIASEINQLTTFKFIMSIVNRIYP